MGDFSVDILRERFIGAMARAATGVGVVSTMTDGRPFALTVSAFNSVSADPPMMLVCINLRSPVAGAIDASGRFVINLLSVEQVRIANVFAGRVEPCFDFGCARWTNLAEERAPRLAAAVATLDCEVEKKLDAGTHRLFIGRVVYVEASDLLPLLYTSRRFAKPCTIVSEAQLRPTA